MYSKRIPRRLSRFVAERAQWRCEYCKSPAAFSTQPFEVDHIIPRSKNGPTVAENLALSCGCNSYKGNTTHAHDPQTGHRVPLFNPRRQRWSRHFAWSKDFIVIIGRTAMGRATVEALHLNRSELLNLRRVLKAAGEHPPKTE
jgi:5-methylcytosine-specific restriction endonuclease McrA